MKVTFKINKTIRPAADPPEKEGIMDKFDVFRNYGCLTAEKRCVYTVGAQEASAIASDKISVKVPAGWEVFENAFGALVAENGKGDCYMVCDILCGNDSPWFIWTDGDGEHRVKLDEC
ncbi:MAG: hypothetical protein ACI4DU_01385 [Lachnospiraceae bacterium]